MYVYIYIYTHIHTYILGGLSRGPSARSQNGSGSSALPARHLGKTGGGVGRLSLLSFLFLLMGFLLL